MNGLAMLNELLVSESEVYEKMVDKLHPVVHEFSIFESEVTSCGASALFDNINRLLLSGGRKTAAFFITSTRLVPVLQWFLVHGNDTHHSIKDSNSATNLIITLIMQGGDLAIDCFRALRVNLPVSCFVPNSPHAFHRWTLLATLLGSEHIVDIHPPEQILPFLPSVRHASLSHQRNFYSRINGTFDTLMFVTSSPDIELQAEQGKVEIHQTPGTSAFGAQGSDSLGDYKFNDGSHILMDGSIEFDRKIGHRRFKFLGSGHPFAFGGAFFEITSNGSQSDQPVGVWLWYRRGALSEKPSRSEESKSASMAYSIEKRSTRPNHPLLVSAANNRIQNSSKESQYLNLIRYHHITAVELETPNITRSRMEDIGSSLSDLLSGEENLSDESKLPRFRVETEFKYNRRKILHHRAIVQAHNWRLRLCEIYFNDLMKDADAIDKELDCKNITAKLEQPTIEKWSRLLVIYHSSAISKVLREAHKILSQRPSLRSSKSAVGKEEAHRSEDERSSSFLETFGEVSVQTDAGSSDSSFSDELSPSDRVSSSNMAQSQNIDSQTLTARYKSLRKIHWKDPSGSIGDLTERALPADPELASHVKHLDEVSEPRRKASPAPQPSPTSRGKWLGVSLILLAAVGTAVYGLVKHKVDWKIRIPL